jgi:hypothetical protein
MLRLVYRKISWDFIQISQGVSLSLNRVRGVKQHILVSFTLRQGIAQKGFGFNHRFYAALAANVSYSPIRINGTYLLFAVKEFVVRFVSIFFIFHFRIAFYSHDKVFPFIINNLNII